MEYYESKVKLILTCVEVDNGDVQKHILPIKEYSKELALSIIAERFNQRVLGNIEIYGYVFNEDVSLDDFNVLSLDEFWNGA